MKCNGFRVSNKNVCIIYWANIWHFKRNSQLHGICSSHKSFKNRCIQLTLNCRYYTALNWKSNYINIIKVIYKGWMSTGRARLDLLSRSVRGLGLSVTIFPYFNLRQKQFLQTMFAIYGFRSEKMKKNVIFNYLFCYVINYVLLRREHK